MKPFELQASSRRQFGKTLAKLSVATLSAFTVATFSVAVSAQSTATTGTTSSQKAKLVIQMSDGDTAKWNLALNNAKNVQEELGADKVEIAIVAYGPGIGMLKLDSAVNSRVSEAAKAGIHIVACENTMRNQKLVKADIHPDASYAPSGVTEIMKKQAAGWAYIRP